MVAAHATYCHARYMPFSNRQLLDSLGRTPFIDSVELAAILGEPRSTLHRGLTDLLAEGIAGRVSHGTRPPTVEPEIPLDGEGHP